MQTVSAETAPKKPRFVDNLGQGEEVGEAAAAPGVCRGEHHDARRNGGDSARSGA